MELIKEIIEHEPQILAEIRAFNKEYTNKTGKKPPVNEQEAHIILILGVAFGYIKRINSNK